jgi:hypothetical protein
MVLVGLLGRYDLLRGNTRSRAVMLQSIRFQCDGVLVHIRIPPYEHNEC